MTDATELDEAVIVKWRMDSEGALRVLMQPHRRQDHERILAALDENARLRAALDEARAEMERRERHDPLWADAFAKIEARAEAAEQERDEAQAKAARHYAAFVGSEAALARAESALAAVRALVTSEQAEQYRDEACRGVVALPYASNRYVRLLDDLRAVLPAPTSPERSDG